MAKINIAELLKDCPKGMELDCVMYDDVKFIDVDRKYDKPICIRVGNTYRYLTKYGTWSFDENAKCVIFPKGKTTWEGFHRPFKDGDVVTWKDRGSLVAFIYKERENVAIVKHHFALYTGSLGVVTNGVISLVESEIVFATEEEKQQLFDAIKANGYKWNAETNTLEKLPKFRKGDWVIDKQGLVHQIKNVVENVTNHTFGYDIVGGGYFNDNSDVRLWTIQDAKDGDVLATSAGAFIYNGNNGGGSCPGSYCGINTLGRFQIGVEHHWTGKKIYPATKEQRDFLFSKMKAMGYKWVAETKTLEKLIEPKFKVGDRVVKKNGVNIPILITRIGDEFYYSNTANAIGLFRIIEQDDWELVPNKFDINTLKPFDKVLVRDSDKDMWCASIFSHTWKDKYFCVGAWHNQCIPYEVNKELLGTTNNPEEYGSR